MADNGALTTGTPDDSCAPCAETSQTQCGVTQNNVGCSTPFCDPKLAALPKTQKGRIVTRVGECLHDTPSVAPGKAQVWVRKKDGSDAPCDLTEDMIPARGDKPCFRSIDELVDGTYGEALIAQTDSSTGKKCIKAVPLDDTDEAYLSGLQAEPVCDGVPDIRPVRIIPEDIEGCPENIRILAAVEEEVEIQPGLKKIKTLWRWLKSIVLSDANLEVREGGEEDGACVLPAAWVRNGDCSTLAKLQLADGVIGAWAYCGGCLKFYELPKTGTGYQTNVSLHYVAGTDCWAWKTAGNDCVLILDTPVVLSSSTANGVRTDDISSHSPPECSKFAIISVEANYSEAGTDASASFWIYINATNKVRVAADYSDGSGTSSDAGRLSALVDVPLISGNTVKTELTLGGASKSCTVKLVGFK